MEDLEISPEPELPEEGTAEPSAVSMDELLGPGRNEELAPQTLSLEDVPLRAVLEAIIYVTEEPLGIQQIAAALGQPPERIRLVLQEMMAELEKPEHGITIREVAGGYKMATKPEHHDAVRNFVKSLKPPLKLSLPALETLAVIAYKQPVTAPEIMDIRGVQGAGVLKTLLDRKLIVAAGRKNVIGKPILYKTSKEFLVQFGLKDLAELPSLKEFEEIRRLAFSDAETPAAGGDPAEPQLAAEDTAPLAEAEAISEPVGWEDAAAPESAPPAQPETEEAMPPETAPENTADQESAAPEADVPESGEQES